VTRSRGLQRRHVLVCVECHDGQVHVGQLHQVRVTLIGGPGCYYDLIVVVPTLRAGSDRLDAGH
jgi:hypothetical protein